MSDDINTNGEDKHFSKRSTVPINSKEQIIRLSRSFDNYLENMRNEHDKSGCESFHRGNKT